MLKKSLFFSLLFLTALAVQAQTVSDNVQFTDLNGKQYDLFKVLESGKHVYIQTVFDG